MSGNVLEQQTYLPEQPEQMAEVYSFLQAHETVTGAAPAPRYLLVGADEHDSVELPEGMYRILRQVVEAMQAGRAVTVAPQTKMLTTQQAADLLGVSRPTVVKLIEDGRLEAETPGTRRRLIRLDEVLRYRKVRREEQYQAIFATSEDYDDDEPSLQDVEKQLRRVRADLAAKRRARG